MRIVVVILVSLWVQRVSAQTNKYLADLTHLYTHLQKTPSYKAQINGDKKAAYKMRYNQLSADSVHDVNDYKYFYNLAQLLFPLRDNHLGFYQVPNYNHFKNKENIAKYLTSTEFADYPTYKINTDSLKLALTARSAELVEGIYYYDSLYTVGLFKANEKEYVGVVMDSYVDLWKKGQVAIHLYENAPNSYKAIYGHPQTKAFIFQSNEKYANQSLLNSTFYGSYVQKIYSKNPQQVDHVNLPNGASKFELKRLDNDIQYLLVKSFQVNPATMERSMRFYDSIKNLVTAPYLILDLRNNEGGSKKASKFYYKLLKQYVKKGQVYILLNNGTLSRAEILTLQLMKLKNIRTVGQTTKGMLTYGSNYGKREKLPSQKFEIYLTDMKGPEKHLQYEDHGIKPDVFFDNKSSWIDQVADLIQREKVIL